MYDPDGEKVRVQNGGDGMRKKKRYVPSAVICRVALIFATLYAGSMGLTTFFVQNNFRRQHQEELADIAQIMNGTAQQMVDDAVEGGNEVGSKWMGQMLNYVLGVYAGKGELPYMLWSGAVWDENGEKIAGSNPICVEVQEENGNRQFRIWNLEDYLAEEELEELSRYVRADSGSEKEIFTKYNEQVSVSDDGELSGILIMYETWEKTDAQEAAGWADVVSETRREEDGKITEEYHVRTESGKAWSWEDQGEGQDEVLSSFSSMITIPGQTDGINTWTKWRDDKYLREFSKQIQGGYRSEETGYIQYGDVSSGSDLTYPLFFQNIDQDSGVRVCMLKLRMTSYSWMQALDYMKYVYIGAAVFMMACMAYVFMVLEKSYRKSAMMQEQRRDFTNAMAHEMKTPLSVIRAFAENLMENPDSRKKNYYLEQMIGQTEEMDEVVKEMIQVSKLDKQELMLKKEVILLSGFLAKEIARLTPRIKQKHIEVTLLCADDIFIEGDRVFLEKAFRCLLDNAVSYNRVDGWIWVEAGEGKIVIANAGDRIPKDALSHVCEMMWTGKQERGSRENGEKHFGMGLYLAERIFCLHGMEIKIENIIDGVQVSITQKR